MLLVIKPGPEIWFYVYLKILPFIFSISSTEILKCATPKNVNNLSCHLRGVKRATKYPITSASSASVAYAHSFSSLTQPSSMTRPPAPRKTRPSSPEPSPQAYTARQAYRDCPSRSSSIHASSSNNSRPSFQHPQMFTAMRVRHKPTHPFPQTR